MRKTKNKKPSKLIYFIRSKRTKFGGAEVYLDRLSLALKEAEIQHEVVNSIFPNFLPSWLQAILFNFQVLITKKDKFYFSLDRITCPDIYRAGDGVHRVFLKVENKSILNPLHPTYFYLEKKCFISAKCIIVNSLLIKNQIIDTYKIDESKIKLVRNGIKIEKLNYDIAFDRLSDEYSLIPGKKYILYVGSGFKRKGVKEFLNIVSKLEYENVKAFVIGKDKNINDYVEIAKEFGIEDKVIFTGPRSDVNDFYTIADIFLFPTHYEPFSNVILEAMSFKNVVFTTRQNGASEILDTKFIMNSPDDFSVADKIDWLLSNTKELKEIQGANRIESKKFSIEENLKQTLNIINEVIN